MANKRFPRKGDQVKLINKNYIALYGTGIFEVVKGAYQFDRDIVVDLKGINIKIPARCVQIIDA